MIGTIFDIKEFALNDGEGIRTTVFLKGCPLRCIWCHNPEGLKASQELYVKQNGCANCGLCRRPCSHPECQEFGRCIHICPNNLVSVAGKKWDHKDLANKLLHYKDIFTQSVGGVTLSGGEPLLQHEFVLALLNELKGKLHCAIETSGYVSSEVFSAVIAACDFVYMDLKLFDPILHKKYTGASNEKILANAEILKKSGIPHTFRIPLIPGITDTEDNLKKLAEFIGEDRSELLPYNKMAPAKYKSVGMSFTDAIDPERKSNIDTSLFKNVTIRK